MITAQTAHSGETGRSRKVKRIVCIVFHDERDGKRRQETKINSLFS